MPTINISVVIATRNRVRLLVSCLEAFLHQDYDKSFFEIIVINDGSSDGTLAFLTQFKKNTDLNFQFVSHDNSGVSHSRNIGISLGRGEYTAFTDDDCIVPNDWLSRIAGLWNNAGPAVAAIGGPLDSPPGNNYVTHYIHFLDEFNFIPLLGKYWITPVHVSKLPDNAPVAYLRTSNAVFRKSCLLEVGGFDVNFKKPGGEDPDLCYRMLKQGYRFHFDKKLVVLHNGRESMGSYFRSLNNYIASEFRKKAKILSYPDKVRSSYFLIPARKTAALFLSIVTAPVTMLNLLYRSPNSFFEGLSFPILLIVSKCYALCISINYQVRYFLNII